MGASKPAAVAGTYRCLRPLQADSSVGGFSGDGDDLFLTSSAVNGSACSKENHVPVRWNLVQWALYRRRSAAAPGHGVVGDDLPRLGSEAGEAL